MLMHAGSSFYEHKQNFIVYGQAGFKSDFGEHRHVTVGPAALCLPNAFATHSAPLRRLDPEITCRVRHSGAHDMRAYDNYYAYVDVAWGGFPSSDGWFVNNSVVLAAGRSDFWGSGYASDCGLVGRPPSFGAIHGNTVYSREHATMRVACLNTTTKACSVSCLLTDWVAQGHDHGTTVHPMPTDDEVMEAARKLLGM
jgi:hypothetical protein